MFVEVLLEALAHRRQALLERLEARAFGLGQPHAAFAVAAQRAFQQAAVVLAQRLVFGGGGLEEPVQVLALAQLDGIGVHLLLDGPRGLAHGGVGGDLRQETQRQPLLDPRGRGALVGQHGVGEGRLRRGHQRDGRQRSLQARLGEPVLRQHLGGRQAPAVGRAARDRGPAGAGARDDDGSRDGRGGRGEQDERKQQSDHERGSSSSLAMKASSDGSRPKKARRESASGRVEPRSRISRRNAAPAAARPSRRKRPQASSA